MLLTANVALSTKSKVLSKTKCGAQPAETILRAVGNVLAQSLAVIVCVEAHMEIRFAQKVTVRVDGFEG